jgi:hypothetical protein
VSEGPHPWDSARKMTYPSPSCSRPPAHGGHQHWTLKDDLDVFELRTLLQRDAADLQVDIAHGLIVSAVPLPSGLLLVALGAGTRFHNCPPPSPPPVALAAGRQTP